MPGLAKPARILIADDHELVRHGMRTILQAEPAWTICGEAATGRDALTKARELEPDLVVLDLGLPELNGLEVTRQLRRESSVPILVVTMQDADQIVQETLNAGANGYVLKADAGRALADAAKTVLERGEYISERVRVAARPGSPDGNRRRRQSQDALTAREREVLQLLAEGQVNKEIATTLGISA